MIVEVNLKSVFGIQYVYRSWIKGAFFPLLMENPLPPQCSSVVHFPRIGQRGTVQTRQLKSRKAMYIRLDSI